MFKTAADLATMITKFHLFRKQFPAMIFTFLCTHFSRSVAFGSASRRFIVAGHLYKGTLATSNSFLGRNSRQSAQFSGQNRSGEGLRMSFFETSKEGDYKRKGAAWRSFVSREEGAKFPPENGRYHLFVAYACPWAHRTLITRALKGLEDVISVTVVHPVWQKTRQDDSKDEHHGWVFGKQSGEEFPNSEGLGGPFQSAYPGNEPEPFFDSFSVRELYERVGDTGGKYSVPILWDKKHGTIVSNESSDIMRMLNSEFNSFALNNELDLYPEAAREAIDSVNEWVFNTVNNGVYLCGFATSQSSYNRAIKELTESFDKIESILKKQRYIAGDVFTEADIRLFVTLLRLDEVYTVYFKTNTRSVATSPTILEYCREIYQMEGIPDTCHMDQTKLHYYCSHPSHNKFSIIPRGRDFMKLLEEPHHREEM